MSAVVAGKHEDVVLDNGLRLVLVPLPAVHRTSVSLFLRVGSRFEERVDNGVSHFLEHMIFRGTPSLASAHEQALAFERLGATLYAATHVDHGVMSVSVPPSSLAAVIRLLGEVTSAPRLSDLEVERGIVREEILEHLDDDGRTIDADDISRAVMYGSHPLGFTITGDVDNLDRFDEPLLRAHHARHYTAESSVLCVAGRIPDTREIADLCARAFEAMPRGRRAEVAAPDRSQKRARWSFVENQSSQTELRIAFRAPSEHDPREPAVEMLLRVLDDGMSTRLYEGICDRLGLCYDVSAAYEAYEDDGVLDVAAGAQHDRAPAVVEEIFRILGRLADGGPTAAELEKAKNRHRWSIEGMLDDAEGTGSFHGLAALAGVAATPEARHAELERVTVADVQDAARTVFVPDAMTVVAVGLLKNGEQKRIQRAIDAFRS